MRSPKSCLVSKLMRRLEVCRAISAKGVGQQVALAFVPIMVEKDVNNLLTYDDENKIANEDSSYNVFEIGALHGPPDLKLKHV